MVKRDKKECCVLNTTPMRSRSLRDVTVFITGASRGIGAAIARRAGRDGANVVLASRSLGAPSHARLEGTLEDVAHEVEEAGGRALPLALDVRDEAQIEAAVATTVSHFGGLGVLVNNASAIDLAPDAPVAKLDLMYQVNARGALLCGRHCLPHLREAPRGHVLALAPPVLSLEPRWIAPHAGYTLSKYGMTLATLGMAGRGVCANTLWPKRVVATAATRMLEQQTGVPVFSQGRSADYVAEAAHAIVCSHLSRHMLLDEDVLPLSMTQDQPRAPLDVFCDE